MQFGTYWRDFPVTFNHVWNPLINSAAMRRNPVTQSNSRGLQYRRIDLVSARDKQGSVHDHVLVTFDCFFEYSCSTSKFEHVHTCSQLDVPKGT